MPDRRYNKILEAFGHHTENVSAPRDSRLWNTPVAIGAVVESFTVEMQEIVDRQRIALHVQGMTSLGEVMLHQNAFRRVLLNLLQNAMDAMPQGGIITIRGRQDDTSISLEIQDTGVGIPQEQFPLLFTSFHSTKPDDTGLGLYVVQQIVTAHEG